MNKKFDIHEWQAKQRLLKEQEQLSLELTDEEKDLVDDMMDNISKRINPTNDVEKSTALFKYIDGWFEVQGGTYEGKNLGEIEVTGMEPDTSNMEKNYKVIGAKKKSEPLEDVSIEYNGKTYVLDFEYGDVIDDHGNEGQDLWFEATADDGTEFMVDAYASNYEATGVDEVFWNTLEITPPKEPTVDEQNSLGAAGSGASFQPGNSGAYMTKHAWRKNYKKLKEELKFKLGKYKVRVSGGIADKI
tara:strand:+ start:377 stop:1111 length:735 start_codon:yes stop_codon:yes gene_type:complete